jgi:hypothetical protein
MSFGDDKEAKNKNYFGQADEGKRRMVVEWV